MAWEARSLITEPTRARARFTPSAMASSLPVNHCAIMADMATDRDSPPNPNTVRPTNMTYQPEDTSLMVMPMAKMSCPSMISAANTMDISRTPARVGHGLWHTECAKGGGATARTQAVRNDPPEEGQDGVGDGVHLGGAGAGGRDALAHVRSGPHAATHAVQQVVVQVEALRGSAVGGRWDVVVLLHLRRGGRRAGAASSASPSPHV